MHQLTPAMIAAVARKSFLIAAVARIGAVFSFAADGAAPASDPTPDFNIPGKVNFSVTCVPAARPEFVRGVALLHSFFYEEARRAFTAAAVADPNCAMAQWGIAMTWWHPIWTPPTPDEMSAGKVAIEKAMAMKPGTDRERGYITALNAYYSATEKPVDGPVGQSCHGPVGPRDRVVAYEAAMRDLYETYGDDFETQAFYALAVLAVGYATPLDTTLANQLRAADLLEKLWAKDANHPGVAHYLIHCYDYPALAKRGVPAANAYAALAPRVPHALHMPSHIYTRLGLWDEAIAANIAAADAARTYARWRGRDATEAEELHARDYAVYSYLQEGRDTEAREIVEFAATVRKTNPALDFVSAYALASIPARYVLERKAWEDAAQLRVPVLPHWAKFPFMEALIEYAHALGNVHTGRLAATRQAVARMRALHDATTAVQFVYFKDHLAQQIEVAQAWLSHAEGFNTDAVNNLRRAADAEDKLGKHPVSPGALVPAREQLGELLLELNRPKEAQEAFEASLAIYPGRYCGLYGAALAAERSGNAEAARRYYGLLKAQTMHADESRRELTHAREYLALVSMNTTK